MSKSHHKAAAWRGAQIAALLFATQSCGVGPASVPLEDDTITVGSVSVEGGSAIFDIHGPVGGPFPQGTRTYTITNHGEEFLHWDFDTVLPWLVATPPTGMIAPSQATDVVVTIDHTFANQLPVGAYPTDMVLSTSSDLEADADGEIFMAFQLSVDDLTPGELVLNPDDELAITTTVGSNATDVDGVIGVSNVGQTAIEWGAVSSTSWLTVGQPDGANLQPGGATELELFVDEALLAASGLGTHESNITVFPTGQPEVSQTVNIEVSLMDSNDDRVTQGLIAEYRFSEGNGNVIHDLSGQTPSMDLVIEDTAAVQWIPGGLNIASPTRLATPGAATRLTNSIKQSGEMTVEAWIRPNGLNQDGPARLVGMSNGPSLRNFTLGQGLWGSQPKDTFNMRCRSTATDLDGMPLLTTGSGAANGGLQHVVYTRRADGQSRLFVDGQVSTETVLGGDFSNWDMGYPLVVANEIGSARPWLGEIYLMAVYERALDAQEIEQNRNAGSGAVAAGQLVVGPQTSIQIQAVVGEGVVSAATGFSVENVGDAGLDWTASVDQSWATLASTSGALAPGQSTESALSFDDTTIGAMAPGTYTATAAFTNNTNDFGTTTRTIQLTVQQPGAPASGDRPGPNNTGPTNTGILQSINGMTITQDGFVLENVNVSGTINVEANNVTIRNFIINAGNAPYAIRLTGGHSGILIEDGELINVDSAHIYGGGFTARRLNMHESGGDGFKATRDVLVERCWVHHIGTKPGAHADCNQTRSGSHFIFRQNFFDLPIDIGAPYKQNAAFIIQTGDGPIDDVLIEDNWLTGGNFTVYIENKWNGNPANPNYGDPTNARLINNRFGREFRFGPLNTTGYVFMSGNRWADTDELMDINNN